jgi:hypothetical protein
VAGKLGPFRAVKTGLGERPKKRGSPEEETHQKNTIVLLLNNNDSILRVL